MDRKDRVAEINAVTGVQHLMQALGVNPFDGDLAETPNRVVKAFKEMTSGYEVDIPSLFKTFENEGYSGMVVLGPIKFTSLCEHHLLPFTGAAWVGYLPNKRTKRIVGLSKLARLVHAYSRRLQVQERLTDEIAAALMAAPLKSSGAGVLIEAHHMCMSVRGVRTAGSVMRTQTLKGSFKKREVQQEFDTLCQRR